MSRMTGSDPFVGQEADELLYDEFGNYIGPDLDEAGDSSSDSDSSSSGSGSGSNDSLGESGDDADGKDKREEDEMLSAARVTGHSQAIVLHEDKNYYPEASAVFGDRAEILVEDEDTQPLETPIIAPVTTKRFSLTEERVPRTKFLFKYLTGLMDHPHLVRNFAFAGHLHHGKTSFVDLLVRQTHVPGTGSTTWSLDRQTRYTDTRFDEQERGLSIKSTPMSLLMGALNGKSYLLNMIDTPGHVNFSDEQAAAFRVCDGVVLVVDAAESVMMQTERTIKYAVQEQLPIVLVINKIDRLITELKLPPLDAYHKLAQIVNEVNHILKRAGSTRKVLPSAGTVCFASTMHGWSFTLPSFAKIYSDYHGNFIGEEFAQRLWGDIYLLQSRRFGRKPEQSGHPRTFVQFILNPLYKMYSYVLSTQGKNLAAMLSEIGVYLTKPQLDLDPKPLLKLALSKFFGGASGFVEMVANHLPSPVAAARLKIEHIYTGPLNTSIGRAMLECDSKGPLMVHVVKMYPRYDCSAFDAFARVFSGTLRVGDKVRVLGEGYALDDVEDMKVCTVNKLWIHEARYRIEVNRATAGNWVLIEGIDESISKTATVVPLLGQPDVVIFRPLHFNDTSTVKVAIEPINPSELPKMLDGLRKINKTYPLLSTRMEESGEHVVMGTGELYLDCALHDLRRMYSEIAIKVADPVSRFCETVYETSSLPCFADSPNGENRLTMIAEPLEEGIAGDIEHRVVQLRQWNEQQTASFFQNKYEWDLLASRSIWAFGPDPDYGPNILCDDTLPSETDKTLLYSVKNDVLQGFWWAMREGPLCEEPVRNVKYKILSATIASDPTARRGNEMIPTARRVAFSSFLLAAPRLMEPVLHVEMQAPGDCIQAVEKVLMRRRGRLTGSVPIPGTPLFKIMAFLPVIDSFGFETDLRTHTQGAAFCMSVFDHWDVVPGDPLDKTITLRPLEPSPIEHLARDFMVKTRRRKGLSEDVSINKFFDDEMLLELAKQDQELQSCFEEEQRQQQHYQ